MEKNEPTILYLCDGKKNCSKRDCYKRIGDCERACKYTKDINHAKNFYKVSPAGTETSFFKEDNVILKQFLEHLAEIRKELQAIRSSMGTVTINICGNKVPADELIQRIESALKKQNLENPNYIPLGTVEKQKYVLESEFMRQMSAEAWYSRTAMKRAKTALVLSSINIAAMVVIIGIFIKMFLLG